MMMVSKGLVQKLMIIVYWLLQVIGQTLYIFMSGTLERVLTSCVFPKGRSPRSGGTTLSSCRFAWCLNQTWYWCIDWNPSYHIEVRYHEISKISYEPQTSNKTLLNHFKAIIIEDGSWQVYSLCEDMLEKKVSRKTATELHKHDKCS